MIRIVLLFCVAAAFVFAAQGAVIDAGRGALWQGRPDLCGEPRADRRRFPCLEVNVSDGDERGYVVLRPPLREPDLILSPTMIELAWFWLRHQPNSALSRWFQGVGAGKGQIRRIAIVALARKLLVAFVALCHPRRRSRGRRAQGGMIRWLNPLQRWLNPLHPLQRS